MKTRTILYSSLVLLSVSSLGFAKGLIGTRYTGLSYAHINYGNGPNTYLDNGQTATAVCNFNRESDMDVKFSVAYTWTDGQRNNQNVDITALGFSLDGVHVFSESEHMKPYVNIGLRYLDVDVTGPGLTPSDSDLGLGFGIGVEFSVTENLFADVSISHDNVGDDDATYFTATGGCWFTDKIVGLIGISRDKESEAVFYSGGIAFPF